MTRVGRRLCIGLQFCPTCESLLPRDDELSIRQGYFPLRGRIGHPDPAQMLIPQPGQGVGAASPNCAQEFAGFFLLLFQIHLWPLPRPVAPPLRPLPRSAPKPFFAAWAWI